MQGHRYRTTLVVSVAGFSKSLCLVVGGLSGQVSVAPADRCTVQRASRWGPWGNPRIKSQPRDLHWKTCAQNNTTRAVPLFMAAPSFIQFINSATTCGF